MSMNWDKDYEENEDFGDDDDGDVDMSPCPLCGEPIYDESECCPHCGEYIVHSTNFLSDKSIWFRAFWLILVTFLIYQMIVLF